MERQQSPDISQVNNFFVPEENSRQHQKQDKEFLFEQRILNSGMTLDQVFKLDRRPNLLEIDITHLQPYQLKFNSTYQYLLSYLIQWNAEVKKSDEKATKIKNAGYKNNLNRSLAQQLAEIVNTQTLEIQQSMLIQVEKWYENQKQYAKDQPSSIPFSALHRSSVMNSSQNSVFFSNNEVSPKNHFRSVDNLNDFNKQNYEDQFRYRTKYQQLEPPSDQLKYYETRQPQISQQTTRPGTTMSKNLSIYSKSRPATRQQSELKLMLSPESRPGTTASRGGLSSAYSEQRPNTGFNNLMSSPQSVRKQSEILQNNPFFQNNSPIQFANFAYQGDQIHQNYEGRRSESAMNQPSTIPNHKSYTKDKIEEHLTSNQDQLMRKTQEVRSIYLNYQPSKGKEEIKLEKKWFQNRHQSLRDKRENEEIAKYINEWANNKGILEQEINSKSDMARYGQRFNELGFQKQKKSNSKVISKQNFQKQKETELEKKKRILFQTVKQNKQKKKLNQYATNQEENNQIQQEDNTQVNQNQIIQEGDEFKDPVEKNENKDSEQQDQETLRIQQNDNNNQNLLINKFKDYSVTEKDTIIQKKEDPEIQPDYFKQYEDYEREIKKQKIKQIRQFRGELIDAKSPNGEEIKELQEDIIQERKKYSISVFARKKHLNVHRPFTTIFKKRSYESIRQEQYNDVKSIKESFMKSGINCSLQILQHAFVIPDGLSIEKMKSIKLPNQFDRLMVNPFQQIKSKTKKSKKI